MYFSSGISPVRRYYGAHVEQDLSGFKTQSLAKYQPFKEIERDSYVLVLQSSQIVERYSNSLSGSVLLNYESRKAHFEFPFR